MEGYGNENPGAFQPTRPLRGATADEFYVAALTNISTHAPLAGRDIFTKEQTDALAAFQPTRPLRGATKRHRCRRIPTTVFQPTRPLRGATRGENK